MAASEESGAPEDVSPRRRLFSHPLARRLPILVVAAVGIWLWRAGNAEREIYWRLPPDRASISQLEIQLRSEDGTLVKREAFSGARLSQSDEITQKISAPDGTYDAIIVIDREGGEQRIERRQIEVLEQGTVVRIGMDR